MTYLKCIYAILLISIFLLSRSNLIKAQAQEGARRWKKYDAQGSLSRFHTVFFDHNSDKIYVGGVNKMYQFDPQNVTAPEKELSWRLPNFIERLCRNFQSDPILCQNSIRVFLPINDTHLYACGTMALRPVCIYVLKSDFSQVNMKPEPGRWTTPSNPYESAVSVFANQTLFTAARGTNHENDPIISRALNGVTLRTLENDKYWLNDPYFVGGYHIEYQSRLQDKVMFFFREKAEEFKPYHYGMANNPNDRNVVSRVATVCVNDHGGSAYVSNRRFATYVKKTIVCDVPGSSENEETPFRYTNLVSTFEIPDGDTSGESVVYGIFTMPNDAISGSAVCAYRMNDIKTELGINNYWRQNTADGRLNASYPGDLQTGPGMCVEETRKLTQTRLTFSRNHPTKFGGVYRSHQTPFYQEPGTRFTHIVVDKVRRNRSSIGQDVTVLYLISTTGLLKRIVFPDNSESGTNWVLPEIQLVTLRPKEKVLNMLIGTEYLYVITNLTIVQMPLAACGEYQSCYECKETRDPYCIPADNGMCSSVFTKTEVEIRSLRNVDVVCPRTQAVPRDQATDLVNVLQRNLSLLLEQNGENERRIASLLSEKRIVDQDLASCIATNENYLEQNNQLTSSLSATQEALVETQRSYNETTKELQHCLKTRRFFMNHAVRMAVDLRQRPTQSQYQQEIRHLSQARNRVAQELQRCQETKRRLLRKATECAGNLRQASQEKADVIATCAQQQEAQEIQFNNTMEGMSTKYANLLRSNKIMNRTIDQISKQLKLCVKKSRDLTNRNSIMRKKSRNTKLQMMKMKQDGKKLVKMFKKYKNQLRCADGRRWILVNGTGNMYTFTDEKATFEEAVTSCRSMHATMATFQNSLELSYFAEIAQSVASNPDYWMSFVKAANNRAANRASILETSNGRTTYCAIFNGTNRLQLSPCSGRRKYICQKVAGPREAMRENPSVSGHAV